MTNAELKLPAYNLSTPQGVKPYRQPQLQEFGKLHLKTLGGGGSITDAPANMGMAATRGR